MISELIRDNNHYSHPFTQTMNVRRGDAEIPYRIELDTTQKVMAVVLSLFAGLLTLPLFIVGGLLIGYSVFVLTTASYKEDNYNNLLLIQHDGDAPPQIPHELPQLPPPPYSRFRQLFALVNDFPKDEPLSETQELIKQQYDEERAKINKEIADLIIEMGPLRRNNNRTQIENEQLINLESKQRYLLDVLAGKEVSPEDHAALAETAALIKRERERVAQEARKAELIKKQQLRKAARKQLKAELRVFMQEFASKVEHPVSMSDLNAVAQKLAAEQKFHPVPDQDTLEPLTEKPIMVGIENPTLTTCWLNSMLKFLASSSWGDQLCKIDVPERAAALQKYLRLILKSIREGEKGKIVHQKLINQFMDELQVFMPDQRLPSKQNNRQGAQQDALSALMVLNSAFNFPRNADVFRANTYDSNCSRMVTRYVVKGNNPGNLLKQSSLGQYHATLDIKLKASDLYQNKKRITTPIDINALLRESDSAEVKPDIRIDNAQAGIEEINEAEQKEMAYLDTVKTSYLAHAPASLVVTVDRAIQRLVQLPNGGVRYDVADKCNRPILFTTVDDDALGIMVQEYDFEDLKVTDEHLAPAVTPKYNCYYRIDGAILHHGADGRAGHYTYLERKDVNTFRHHNDTQISVLPIKAPQDGKVSPTVRNYFKDAVLLNLTLVKKIETAQDVRPAPQVPARQQPAAAPNLFNRILTGLGAGNGAAIDAI